MIGAARADCYSVWLLGRLAPLVGRQVREPIARLEPAVSRSDLWRWSPAVRLGWSPRWSAQLWANGRLRTCRMPEDQSVGQKCGLATKSAQKAPGQALVVGRRFLPPLRRRRPAGCEKLPRSVGGHGFWLGCQCRADILERTVPTREHESASWAQNGFRRTLHNDQTG
jgi:hypothetical protein